jgi:hypothetical protein
VVEQLRVAGNDASGVARLIADGVTDDALQHAGQAILRCSSSPELIAAATTVIESLSQRDWPGDRELIAELEHVGNGTTSELTVLAVDLDEIGEALDQSPATVSYIDLADGTVWPGELFDVDKGPEDFDADNSDRWLPVVGAGPKDAYAVMERFIETIVSPGLASRLRTEINGSGAFRRFQTELSRHDDDYTRWHRFVTMPASETPDDSSPITAIPLNPADGLGKPYRSGSYSFLVRFSRRGPPQRSRVQRRRH